MCGIYGVVAEAPEALNPNAVARMADSLVHRGPDGDGRRTVGRATLGCRRLAIIDVVGGAQPLTDESGGIVVVCNGEIYNHHALREDLIRRGHTFRTGSDAEVIPHLYEEHGLDFVDRLDGMFAIALWDAARERMVLVRDRIGEKPLYHALTRAGLLFASEPKAILASGLVDAVADGAALAGYLRTGYVATPRSAFRGIAKVVPGTRVIVERGVARVERFWDVMSHLAAPALPLDLTTAAGHVRRALEDAVDETLVSDVPVGVFLSGGLDSTAVAALARRRLGPDLNAFTLGFDVAAFDERDWAAFVARTLDVRQHVVMVTPELFLDGLHELVQVLDEPMADQSYVPTYLLAREARRHVKVVLVGEGSDELFAGYPTYVGGRWASRYRRLPDGLRHAISAAAPYLGTSHGNNTLRYLFRRFLEMAEAPLAVRHRAWTGCMSPDDVAATAADGSPLVDVRPVDTEVGRSELDTLLGLDITGYLRDDLLTNLDRASMAASLEGRAPFLNHHLVELACRLGPELKLRGLIGKRVLRRAVADIVPPVIRRRIKRGLSVPFATWFAGPLLPFVRDTLSRMDPGVVRPAVVDELIDAHTARRRDNRRELWALIVLQLWVEASRVRWRAVPLEARPMSEVGNAVGVGR